MIEYTSIDTIINNNEVVKWDLSTHLDDLLKLFNNGANYKPYITDVSERSKTSTNDEIVNKHASQKIISDMRDSSKIGSLDDWEELNKNGGAHAKVVKVVDGDTIWVYANGKYYKIRFMGIDTPEIAHKDGDIDQCYGEAAYQEMVKVLLGEHAGSVIKYDGTYIDDINNAPDVFIELDDIGDRVDQYGRILAYVHIVYNGNFINVNRYMLMNGFAYTTAFQKNSDKPSDFKFKERDEFIRMVKEAKKNKVGLWADYEKGGTGGCGGERIPTGVSENDLVKHFSDKINPHFGDIPFIHPNEVTKYAKQRLHAIEKQMSYYPYLAASLYNNITKWGFERSIDQLDQYEQLIGGKIDFGDVTNTLSTYPDMVLPYIGNIHGITPLFFMQIRNPINYDFLDTIAEDLKYQENTILSIYLSQVGDYKTARETLIKQGVIKPDTESKDIYDLLKVPNISEIPLNTIDKFVKESNTLSDILTTFDPDEFKQKMDNLPKESVTDVLLHGMGNIGKNDAKGLLDIFRIMQGIRVYTRVREYAALINQVFGAGAQPSNVDVNDLAYDKGILGKFIYKDEDSIDKIFQKDGGVNQFIGDFVDRLMKSSNDISDKTFGDLLTMRVQLSKDIFNDILSLTSIVEAASSDPIQDSLMSLFKMWGLESPDTILKRRKMFRKTILQSFNDVSTTINKVFPTFRIYIINPESPFVKSFEDFYDVRAIESIDVYRDKSGIDSTAHIVIVDKLGHLLIGENNYQPEVMTNTDFLPNKYKDLVLRQGMKILIYMGYNNTEKHLPLVFRGTITDVVPDDNGRIEIVAQDYGAEALTKAGIRGGGDGDEKNTSGVVDIGSTMMMAKYGDILAYIFKISNSMPNLGSKVPIFDPHYRSVLGYTGFAMGGLWKYIIENVIISTFDSGVDADYLIRYIFGGLGRLMENIFLDFLPAHFLENPLESFGVRLYKYLSFFMGSKKSEIIKNIFINGLSLLFPFLVPYTIKNFFFGHPKNEQDIESAFGLEYKALSKTIADVIMEISNFHPGFITAFLPYFDGIKYNDTIYVGKKTGLYKFKSDFTSRVVDGYIIRNYLDILKNSNSKSSKDLLDKLNKDYFDKNKYSNRPENYSMDLYHMLITDAPDIASTLQSVKYVQNFHFASSTENIIKNNIMASSSDMHNVVNYYFTDDVIDWSPGLAVPNANKFKNFMSLGLSDSISDDSRSEMDLYSANTDPNWLLSYFYTRWLKTSIKKSKNNKNNGNSEENINFSSSFDNDSLISALPSYMIPPINVLANEVSKMYKGELIILGQPNVNPYDVVYIQDDVNDMFGFCEVEAVLHHFSYETGYVTVIQPALLTYEYSSADEYSLPRVLNFMKRRSIANVSGSLLKGLEGFGLGTSAGYITGLVAGAAVGGPVGAAVGAVVGTVGLVKTLQKNAQVTMIRMAKFMARNSVNLIPLWYRGLPYVAGIDGYRKASVESMVLDKYADRPFTRILVAQDPWTVGIEGLSSQSMFGLIMRAIGLGRPYNYIKPIPKETK